MSKSQNKLWNELDMVFEPYNSHFRTTITSNLAPNYWPHVDQTFYAHGSVEKSFPMSRSISTILLFTDIIDINMTDMSLIVDE